MKTPRTNKAFTLIELLVVIVIIAILASFAIPGVMGAIGRAQLVQALNNARELHKCAITMSHDRMVNNPNVGWPGDLSTSGSSSVTNESGYFKLMVDNDYIKGADLAKLVALPGVTPFQGTDFSQFDASKNSGFKVYKCTEADAPAVIFVATANYTYNTALDPAKQPFGDKGFVVFRKGGDGGMYKKGQATGSTNMQTVGLLPGQADFTNVPTGDGSMALDQK